MNRWLRSNIVLFCLGLLTLSGYLLAAFGWEFYSSRADVFRFLGLMSAQFFLFAVTWFWMKSRPGAKSAATLWLILAWAAGFRGVMIFVGLPQDRPFEAALTDLAGEEVVYHRFLLYDHDVWRYLWDGHVSATVGDPYRSSPESWWRLAESGHAPAQALFAEEVWDDVYDFLGYADHLTVYPPLAQAYFRLCHAMAPGSVFFHKAAIVGLDIAVCWLLVLALRHLGRPGEEVLLYAWNPLIVKEFAGSGHLDPLMLFFLVAAILLTMKQRHKLAMLSFGGAILAKFVPLVLIPVLLRRWPWRWWWLVAVPLVIGFGIYADSLAHLVSGIGTFASDWVFNPGPWALLDYLAELLKLPAAAVTVVVGLILVAGIEYCLKRDRGDAHSLVWGSFLIMACVILLSPAVMPWYLSWALVLAVLAGNRTWVWLTFLALGSYLIYMDQTVRIWWLWVEYTLFFMAVIWFDRPLLRAPFQNSQWVGSQANPEKASE